MEKNGLLVIAGEKTGARINLKKGFLEYLDSGSGNLFADKAAGIHLGFGGRKIKYLIKNKKDMLSAFFYDFSGKSVKIIFYKDGLCRIKSAELNPFKLSPVCIEITMDERFKKAFWFGRKDKAGFTELFPLISVNADEGGNEISENTTTGMNVRFIRAVSGTETLMFKACNKNYYNFNSTGKNISICSERKIDLIISSEPDSGESTQGDSM